MLASPPPAQLGEGKAVHSEMRFWVVLGKKKKSILYLPQHLRPDPANYFTGAQDLGFAVGALCILQDGAPHRMKM